MALMKSGVRLLWLKSRFIRFIKNETNPSNKLYFLQLHTQAKQNSQYVSNPPDSPASPNPAVILATQCDVENLKKTLENGNLETKEFMSVVKSLSTSGHGEYIPEAMKYLPQGADIQSNDCVSTIVELTRLGKVKDAYEIVKCWPANDSAEDCLIEFADFYLHEMVRCDIPMKDILEICRNLDSSKKYSSALLKVTESALRLKKEDAALLAFQAMQNHGIEIRPHFYWPLLLNAAATKPDTDVIKLVKHMSDNKVHLDDETLFSYTIPLLSTKDPLMITRQLQDCGVKISQILTPLLSNLLSRGNLKQAIALTNKIKGKINGDFIVKYLLQGYLVTRNVDATAKVLSNINTSSNQNGKFLMDLVANEKMTVTNEELGSLVIAFDLNKLKICRTAAQALEPRITRLTNAENLLEKLERLIVTETNTSDAEFLSRIPHPRNMTAEELEDHLADLSTNGMNTRGVLRKLVQTYCGQNNLSKAEKFAKMFDDKGFEWTTGMIAGMFSLYAANNMNHEAEIRYKELREEHKKFRIDDHKIIDFATSLVNNKKLERALEVLAEQENIKCRPETSRNCWRFVHAVAAAAPDNSENIKRALALLVDKGYCEINNHVLGPLIRAHLSNGDLLAAIAEFKECVRIYRKSPLQQELLRAIVQTYTGKLEDHAQLTELLNMIKNLHGNTGANSQLFMALAATNKQKEVHNLMKMPAINQTILNKSVEKLTDETDLAALQTILNACRGVKKLNYAIIYDSILTLCNRSGDYKTALQVWDKMKSDDVNPSRQFVEKLKDLLASQKITLPPELHSDKTQMKR